MTFIKYSTSFITIISSKNKEIDWLKIEIKNLKQERETLLQIIRDMY